MAYLTETQLRAKANIETTSVINNIKQSASIAQLSIFLSHSHKDIQLVEGFIKLMGSQGITVYVDKNDKSMPRETSKETAEKIKVIIKDLNIFVIFCTYNAMKSVWVPWETGIADQCKRNDQIFIIPIADNSGNFYGNEYFQLYRRIELDSSGNLMIVVPKQQLNEAISFSKYFRDKIRNGL